MDMLTYGSPSHAEIEIENRDKAVARLTDIRKALEEARKAPEFSGRDGSRQCLFAAAQLLDRIEQSICTVTTQEVERSVQYLRGMKPHTDSLGKHYPKREATALLRLYRAAQPAWERRQQERGAPK